MMIFVSPRCWGGYGDGIGHCVHLLQRDSGLDAVLSVHVFPGSAAVEYLW